MVVKGVVGGLGEGGAGYLGLREKIYRIVEVGVGVGVGLVLSLF
jgi:hypothetical protein